MVRFDLEGKSMCCVRRIMGPTHNQFIKLCGITKLNVSEICDKTDIRVAYNKCSKNPSLLYNFLFKKRGQEGLLCFLFLMLTLFIVNHFFNNDNGGKKMTWNAECCPFAWISKDIKNDTCHLLVQPIIYASIERHIICHLKIM